MYNIATATDDERLAYYSKLDNAIADIAESNESPETKSYKLLEQIASQLVNLSLTVDHLWLGLNGLHATIEKGQEFSQQQPVSEFSLTKVV